jgi:hypothetical protein
LAEQFRAVQNAIDTTAGRRGSGYLSHRSSGRTRALRPANAGSPIPVFTTTTAVLLETRLRAGVGRLPERAPGLGREVGVFKSRPEHFCSVAQSLRSASP